MSDLVTIPTEVRDEHAVAAAGRRLGLPEPARGIANRFERRPPGYSCGCPAGPTRSSSTRPPAGSAATITSFGRRLRHQPAGAASAAIDAVGGLPLT